MAQFQLVMRSGPTPGATYPLEGDQLTIGRDSSNGVAINDAEMSRKHARLTFQGGKYVIEDLGSTNGTFVNGQRLSGPFVLKGGDVVSFGEQIVLMYDVMSGDPGATIASPRRQSARVPAPMAPPPPVQVYSGQVASGPVPQKSNMTPIFIIAGVILFICLCAAFFWYVDANFLWCTIFPFLGGC
ncbi:MAG: FHA domain-containing protein [Anaerolineales bacterium]|nr:FHA domain-containing protein [Anaerolineales bacterium]